jgi:HD superfamily phosphodiesterase
MNRIEVLRNYIDELILQMPDVEQRRHAFVHLYGVAQACTLIALKRGQDAELSTMAGMLHDVYSYSRMDTQDHAHKGAVLAREILQTLKLTEDDETDLICQAIYTHSDKASVHPEFNELLKDADVLQQCLYNPTIEILAPERKNRYLKLMHEFGVPRPFPVHSE